MNQCDGCNRGIPKIKGVHDDGTGLAGLQGCTASRYEEKVIFLDIDGVLTTRRSMKLPMQNYSAAKSAERKANPFTHLDDYCVEQLNKLTAQTSASLVISSSWRIGSPEMFEDMCGYLKLSGVEGSIIDRTPSNSENPMPLSDFTKLVQSGKWSELPARTHGRGEEIAQWLEKRPSPISFVILDDDNFDMGKMLPALVQTSMELGLQPAHIERAIEYLERAAIPAKTSA